MNWKEAQKVARQTGCAHALAVALESLPIPVPADDQAAVVMCKEKIRRGIEPDDCDGRCPR